MKARFHGICHLCGHEITVGQRVVPRNGDVIHEGCAPGADDE